MRICRWLPGGLSGPILTLVSLGATTLPAASETLLVFPPENLSKTASLDWIGEAIAISLSDQLRIPDVEVLDRKTRLTLIENSDLPHTATLSQASMIRVGQQASASTLVFGSYSGSASDLRIVLQVLDLSAMKLGSEIKTSGSIEALPEMENELAWQILSRSAINTIYSRREYRAHARAVPNSAFSHYVKSLFATDEEAKAKLLTRALELHPDFPEVLFLLGSYFYRKSDCTQAIANLELVRGRSLDFPEAQFMLATCFFRDGAYARSVVALRSILSRTQAMEVLNNLGVAYVRLEDWPRASQALTQARRIAHSHPIPASNQAIAEFLRGNSRIALDILNDAIRVSPGDGMLHWVAGAIHQGLGDADKGDKATEQARRLGLDTEKLKSQKPHSWARWFDTWDSSP